MSTTIQAMNEKRNILANQMRDVQKRSSDGVMPADDHAKFMQLYAETEQIRQSIEAAKLMANVDAFGEKVEERTQRDEHAGKITHESAFTSWIRGNDLNVEERSVLMQKRGTNTQVVGTAGLGGYLVPQSWATEIYKIMTAFGGVLTVARLIDTDTGEIINYPITSDTEVAALIAESAALAVGDSTFTNVQLTSYMYSTKVIKASLQLLRDSKFNVVEWVQYTLGERMGKGLNLAITLGTGSSQPQGVVVGSALGATHSAITRAKLNELKFSVLSPYREVGSWMMNSTSLGQICALEIGSGDARPLWQPSIRDGEPDRLEGRPIIINEQMDSVGSGNKPVLFGDFKQFAVRRVGSMEVFPFTELYMANLHKAWTGYQAFDSRILYSGAIKHLVIS